MSESNLVYVLRVSVVGLAWLLASITAGAQITTVDLDSGQTASSLAQLLAGPGVSVSNAKYTGANVAAGAFQGGGGIIGFDSGVILSTGNVADVPGPNDSGSTTTSNGMSGDAQLNALAAPLPTRDAAALELDIVTSSSTIFIQYVFSSEEYNEWVLSGVNDVFGLFVDGSNCALVNGGPVSIDTINNSANAGSYIDNTGGTIDTEMDGLTVVLTCQAPVKPGVPSHVKLAIADVSDMEYDSNVFLKAGGITTTSQTVCRNRIDAVPAATLLLPYFEVDIADANGVNTVFSINNASAESALAHVTVWTDQSVPALDFDVFLTGYDIQTINLRDIFVNGNLPQTSGDGFPSCRGVLPYLPGAVSTTFRAHLQAWFQGNQSPATGNCAGAKFRDNILRGYVTVDTVNACNLFFPSDWDFYKPFLSHQNVLWGDYYYINPSHNYFFGETLVHIESCPGCYQPGDHTFYGRYNGASAEDAREPLPTALAARYIGENTDFFVWREANHSDSAFSCGNQGPPSWYPLRTRQIVIFDEQETPYALDEATVLPHEANRIDVSSDLLSPFSQGWVYLNLQHPNTATAYGDNAAQAWVTVLIDSGGPLSITGYHAIQLDTANNPVTRPVP